MMRWFGPDTAAPFYTEGLEKVPVPIGQKCLRCNEPILESEYGVVIDDLDAQRWTPRARHHECWAREMLGSFAHQAGVCSCPRHKHAAPLDDSLFSTPRNAARAALILHELLHRRDRGPKP